MNVTWFHPVGLLIILLLIQASPVFVYADGTSAAVVLTFPVGARPLALGEAFVSVEGDPHGLHYNPACVARMSAPTLAVFYEAGSVDDGLGGCIFVHPTGSITLAGGLSRYSSGTIDLTEASGGTHTVDGQSDYILVMSLGHGLSGNFAMGANVKLLRSTLVERFTTTVMMFDVGCLIRPLGNKFTIGASVQNLGGKVKYLAVGDPLPWVVKLGGSMSLELAGRQATAAIDVVRWRRRDANLHMGIEFWLSDNLGIRSGYRTRYDSEWFTVGFGLALGNFNVNYGADLMQDLNATQIIDLTYTF